MEKKYLNSGAIFINDRKTKDSQPDLTGSLLLEGIDPTSVSTELADLLRKEAPQFLGEIKYRLASWKKESKSGKKFISISASIPEEEQAQPAEVVTEEDPF